MGSKCKGSPFRPSARGRLGSARSRGARRGKRKRADLLKSVKDISPNKSKREVAALVAECGKDVSARIRKTREMVTGFFKFVRDSPEVARSSYEKLSKANFPFEAGSPVTNLWGAVKMFAGLLADVGRMRDTL